MLNTQKRMVKIFAMNLLVSALHYLKNVQGSKITWMNWTVKFSQMRIGVKFVIHLEMPISCLLSRALHCYKALIQESQTFSSQFYSITITTTRCRESECIQKPYQWILFQRQSSQLWKSRATGAHSNRVPYFPPEKWVTQSRASRTSQT